MTRRFGAFTTIWRRPISSSRTTSNANAITQLLPANTLLEEEKNPDYDPKRFYPARIGETVNGGKYQIISKLGFGNGSTVWLAEEMNR
jgi:serine/threonine-protein kinase SRPK3